MLNRRILRIKVFKVLYAYAENQGMTLKEAQALFSRSCEATRDLWLFLLGLIPTLRDEASLRIEAARGKFHPTEEERNPNMKFVRNRLSALFDADPDFNKLVTKKKLSWEQYDAFLRKLYETVRSRQYFLDYMASGDESIAEDASLFVKIFEQELEDSEDLQAILEDLSILWVDDLAYALIQCCKTIATLGEGKVWNLPELVTEENSAFASQVLRTGFANFAAFRTKIAGKTGNWDDDRLFNVDVALIITGLAEMKSFPGTPRGVVINEYVEISKYYSTPKSRAFVNGMLDEIIKNGL